MTLSPAKVGGWSFGEKLTAAQMNALQAELVKAIDGVNGGTYALQSDITFDGPAAFHIGGEMEVDSGALLNIAAGGTLTVVGDVDVLAAGEIFVSGDLEIMSGGDFIVHSGGEIACQSGCVVSVADLSNLTALAASQEIRHSMTPMDVKSGWTRGVANGFFEQSDTSSAAEIAYALAIDEGDVINQIRVQIFGGDHTGNTPATRPIVRLIRVDHDAGTQTTLATLADTTTGATYAASHNISLNSTSHPGVFPLTQDGRHLVVAMTGETGANAVNNRLRMMGIFCNIAANFIRAPFAAK